MNDDDDDNATVVVANDADDKKENNNDQILTKVSSSIFKPKPSKLSSEHSQSKKVEEDEDTVDIDFPASMRGAPMTLTAEASLPSGASTPRLVSSSSNSAPVKVSLFKHQGGQTRGRKRKKGKGGCEDLHYDSDSIDIDVLATFSAKTFEASAQSVGCSPPALERSSNSSDMAGAFSVLLKKPLKDELATAKKTDEGQCDSDKKLAVVNTEEIKTPAVVETTKAAAEESEDANRQKKPIETAAASKVNALPSAFSLLMAPKRKNKNVEEDAVSAMPKNDNDTSIGINGDVSATSSVDAQSAIIQQPPPSKRPKKKRGRPPKAASEDNMKEAVEKEGQKKPLEVATPETDLNSSLNDFVVTEDAIKADEKEQDNGRRQSQRIRRNHQLKMEKRSLYSSDQKMAESEDEVLQQEEEEWEEDRSVSDLRRRPQKRLLSSSAAAPTNRRSGAKKKQKESLESQLSERRGKSSLDGKAKITTTVPFEVAAEAGDSGSTTAAATQSDDDEIKIEKVIEKTSKKPIAPIFQSRKFKKASGSSELSNATVTVEEDPEKVAARKAFLLSSVPQALKSQVDRHRSSCDEIATLLTPFASTIGHVTQIVTEDAKKGAEENFPLKATEMLKLRRNFLEDEPFAIKTSMAGYHGKELKVSDSSSPTVATTQRLLASMEQKSPRLTAPQIYSHFLSIRQGLLPSEGEGEEIERLQFTRAFRRYLERKIEADTLEEEARSKNVSLNEIEEKRGAASRRLRSSRKKKAAASEIKQPNTTPECKVKYDPEWPSSMQWTMKYAPQCAEDIIGNSETVKELASWLREWEMRDVKRRKRCNKAENAMDSSDSESDSISTYR